RMADSGGWSHACRHHAAEQAVQMSVLAKVIGKDVVGDQTPEVAELAGSQQGEKGSKVAGTRALTHLDQHSKGCLGAGLFERRRLMVRANARGHVCLEILSRHPRRMTIQGKSTSEGGPKFL